MLFRSVIKSATSALMEIGLAAIALLGSALLNAPGPQHRGVIVVILSTIAGRAPAAVAAALSRRTGLF